MLEGAAQSHFAELESASCASHSRLQKLANVSHGAWLGNCLFDFCIYWSSIHPSIHACILAIAKPEKSYKVSEVTCRELTPKWCKSGMCRKCLFYGNKWPFYGRKCTFYGRKCTFYGRKCTFYGLSTVCLRSLSVTSNEQRAQQISALRLDLM